jgi:hypothetical protein
MPIFRTYATHYFLFSRALPNSLKDYCEKTNDPLFPDSGADNPFTDRGGGGGCNVL